MIAVKMPIIKKIFLLLALISAVTLLQSQCDSPLSGNSTLWHIVSDTT